MKEEQDYIQDLADVRHMMERSSKFLSLSGLAGILAGIYALAGAVAAYKLFEGGETAKLVFLGAIVLVLALGTAIYLSWKKARKNGEKFYNSTTRRLASTMAVPLVAGGLMMLAALLKNMDGLLIPFSLVFYGIALYNAGKISYEEVKSLGLVQIVLGLISCYFVEYGLICWALGFGLAHIVYGVYLHYRYER